mgnify:CR=1 FL=1
MVSLFRRRDRRDELWRKLLNEVQTIGVACRSDTAAATVCVAHSCHRTHTACVPALYVCSYRESAALEVVDTCTEVTTNVRRLTEDINNAHERYLRNATPTSLSHHCADVNSVLAPAAPSTAAQPTSEYVPPLPAPVATLARPRPLAVAQLADNALLSVRRPLRDAQEQVRPPLHRAVCGIVLIVFVCVCVCVCVCVWLCVWLCGCVHPLTLRCRVLTSEL